MQQYKLDKQSLPLEADASAVYEDEEEEEEEEEESEGEEEEEEVEEEANPYEYPKPKGRAGWNNLRILNFGGGEVPWKKAKDFERITLWVQKYLKVEEKADAEEIAEAAAPLLHYTSRRILGMADGPSLILDLLVLGAVIISVKWKGERSEEVIDAP